MQNMCSLPMVFFFIQILNKYALSSRNGICREYALFGFFLLRFDSDKCDLTQTLLRHLAKEMVSGASAAQLSHLPSFVSFFLMEEISP